MSETAELTKIKNLPSPKGHFLLGHLPQFNAANKHQVLERWVDECGDLFKINFVGKEFLVSADAAFNDQVLKLRPNKFKRFSKIDEILSEMGVTGVFNAEGETWKRQRKPIAEALNMQNVKRFHPIIVDKTKKILRKFQHYANQKTTVDVQKEFMRFTIDITTAIAFGYEMDTINNKADDFQEHLEIIFPMINERITAPLPIWRFYKQEKDKKLQKALVAIEKLIYTFINDAQKRLANNPELKEKPTNFLEALLVENIAEPFTDEEVYGNVFTMLLAGEDTTSNSISWTIYYLAQHPEVVKKIRQEALTVYPGDAAAGTNEQCAQLVYTKAVAQEAIRLKPTTPQLYFEAQEEVVIENVVIPKNTRLILQNKVGQTRESYFSNADTFITERWLKGGCPMHQNHSPEVMKSFGGGARFCPGMHLAMNEMTVLISAICKQFDIALAVKKDEIKEQFSFTMHPENLRVQFTPVC